MAHRTLKELNIEIAELERKIAVARDVLAQLERQIDAARNSATHVPGQLVEVNERLIVAAMEQQDATDSAIQALDAMALTAQLDPLTKLPNRTMMHDRITQTIASAKRHHQGFALLFIDVNDFKYVNDNLGHPAGDDVLQQVSRRLVGAVREVDTVSRHGGDEFLILLPEVGTPADATNVADKVALAIAAPMIVGGRTLQVGISVGLSLHPQDGAEAEALIASADAAMYRVKRSRHHCK